MFQELILGISLTHQLTGSKCAHMNTISGMFLWYTLFKSKGIISEI
jgi:hypothetical protein